jgi:hypothetical protein
VAAGVAFDRSNNANVASNQITLTYDQYFGLPTVSMHSPDAGRFRWTTDSPFYVYATFHEPVFGFDINDVSASGGTVNLVEEQACARAPCLPSPPSTPSPTCSRRVEAPVRQLLGRAYIRTTVVPCYSDAQERGRQHTGWGNGSQRNSGGNSRWTHAPLREGGESGLAGHLVSTRLAGNPPAAAGFTCTYDSEGARRCSH